MRAHTIVANRIQPYLTDGVGVPHVAAKIAASIPGSLLSARERVSNVFQKDQYLILQAMPLLQR
jgi:hypothetical protein